ncbi:MAG: tetratricopeptide repeat protein [Planctomycetes bacterium]|nr:tetratricopeptide repeat protein [Planctomycetota bacterium]
MRPSLNITIVPVALMLAACGTVSGPMLTTYSVASRAARPQDPPQDPAVVEASARRDGANRIELSDEARELLHSPSFQRRLIESYVSETETEPRFDEDEHEIMLTVMGHVTAEEFDQAEAIVRQHQSPKASAVFDFTLGNILYQRDDFEGAAAAYEIAVQKHPRFRRAWGNLAQIQYTQGKYADAKRALTRVISFGGGDSVNYALLGVCHQKTDDYIAAESAFRMAIMLDPSAVNLRMALAETLFKQGRFEDAVALFEHLIAEEPDRSDLWMLQGEAYAMLNQPLKAAENFEFVDRLGGSTFASLSNLGDIYASQSLFDLSVQSYLRALEQKPDGDTTRAMRAAQYLSGHGAHAEMRVLLDGIESICGEHLDLEGKKRLLKLKARLAVAEGATEERAAELQKVVALDPLDGDALILLGRHYGEAGEVERAIVYFEQAANLEGFEAEASLRHGELLVKQNKFVEALPLLNKSYDLRPREFVKKYIEDIERLARSAK